MRLQKAERKKVKLKMNLSGTSGSGKTMSALLMAYGITKNWEKVAVIDTENNSSSLYSHLGEFQVIDLAPPYHPNRYIQAIDICIEAGIECLIIDSTTHEWNGEGGCIDINEKLAQVKYRGNTWSAWNETTPMHDKFINKILQSDLHIITCTRSKSETVMGEDKKVKKVGMKDMQRDGFEYELTVSLSIDRDTHMAVASKDRTGLFTNRQPFVISESTGQEIRDWCEKGVDVKTIISNLINDMSGIESIDGLKDFMENVPAYAKSNSELRSKANEIYKSLIPKKEDNAEQH